METRNRIVSPIYQPSTINHQLILRSRVVLPISRPPVKDGAILIRGNRIAEVGRWRDLSAQVSEASVVDLGDAVLLPGLVNAHCHLDYTDMARQFPPQKSFTDWIKLITTAKSEWSYTEFAESWLRGSKMLVRTGTTTVADFENVPELLPEVWIATPLRVISFLEMTGVKSRRDPHAILREALERIESLAHERSSASLAPHAPYSTTPELVKLSAEAARRRQWPLSIHVAESAQEFEMFKRARGVMFDWLKRNERDMSDCGLGSPIQQMHRCGALEKNLLAVHVNYLGPKDAALLKRKKVSVAHCPRSHSYFQHAKFPFDKLTRVGVNICLGTDSLATVIKTRKQTVELNMFEEMRAFSATHPRVPAKRILQMATINGARALGQAGQLGEISKGALADLIAIPFAGKIAAVHETVLQHEGEVTASMINGQWAIAPDD
jgi:cytosine/adenosine deaminase-related metal-dependent hydrolase